LREKEMLQIASAEFSVGVIKFFAMLYADDTDFPAKYHSARGDKDLTIERWTPSEYGTFRILTYRAPVRAAVGPRTTRLQETQRYHLQKERLVVEIVSVMHDIPYGDYFRVESKHEVIALAEDRCRLTIGVGLHFTKSTFFEAKLRKDTMKESKESFELWAKLAVHEIDIKKVQRRKVAKTISKPELMIQKQPQPQQQEAMGMDLTSKIPLFELVKVRSQIPTLLALVLVLLVLYLLLELRSMKTRLFHLETICTIVTAANKNHVHDET